MTHYYSPKQEGEFSPYRISVNVAGLTFELYSASGVFSKDELDKGSRALIELSDVKDEGSLLDLGCGYGAVGIAIAKLRKGIELTMADVNERAIRLARMNAGLHRIRADIIKSDVYSGLRGKKFDCILLNPPQTAGRDICLAMIRDAKEHLNSGGSIQFVARKNKGGETLAKAMQEHFGNCEVLGRSHGFTVWKSVLDDS